MLGTWKVHDESHRNEAAVPHLHIFLPVCFNHLVECRRSLGLGYVHISLRSPIEHWEVRLSSGTDCGAIFDSMAERPVRAKCVDVGRTYGV